MIGKIGLLVFLLSSYAYGQRPQGMVEAEVVCFIRDSNTISLELTYAIQQGALSFIGTGNSWTAEIPVIAEVWQDDKRIAQETVTKKTTFTGTNEELQSKAYNLLLDKVTFIIPAKKNTVVYFIFHGKDPQGVELFDTLRRLTYVPVQKQDSFVFSGVELASRLEASETQPAGNPFYRVGYVIYPNPSLLFGGDYSTLNFYTELNTPAKFTNVGDSIEMRARILDGQQSEIVQRIQKIPLIAPRTPFLGTFDIEALGTDSYSLVITATYKEKVIAAIRKGFYFENSMIVSEEAGDQPTIADDETIYQQSEISKYSDLELAEKIEQSGYLMPNDTRKSIVKNPNAGEKKRLLFKFWRSKDEPGTRPMTEFRNFLIRLDEANRQFTYQKTIGWKTPRGRVYIAYGAPEFVGGEPFSTESKPYIVWQYYTRRFPVSSGSKAEFVFVDLYGGGNYQLVHSNVRGEVSQPDWYRNEAFRLR
jgi:GWxTD domain-containing protein